MATAGETDREASAARMATQHDRTRHAPRAQMRDQIGDVILVDIFVLSTTPPATWRPIFIFITSRLLIPILVSLLNDECITDSWS